MHMEGRLASRRLVASGILTRHVSRQLVRPFLIGFCVVTFLLTLDFLLDYLDLFLGKGIPFLTVSRLFVLGLGWMIALSVPCGVLVAVLMAYGQMSQDNEITALRASGVNPFHLMLPSLAIALMTAVGLALFNNYLLPETNHAFANLVAQIHRIRPTVQIQEATWIDDFKGYDLFIRQLDDRSGAMRDITIIDASQNRASPRTILAQHGMLRFLPEQNEVSLTLRDGAIHEADPKTAAGGYRRLTFEEQTMVLSGASDAFYSAVRRQRGQREMSVSAMRGKIASLEEEMQSFQIQVDSALVGLNVTDASELPPLNASELEPKGFRKVLGGVLAFFGAERPAPPELPDVTPDQRRKIEELRVRILQTEGVRKRIDQFHVEIQKKFSIPFACIVFVLIGAPLGMRARRGGIAVGFFSVAFFLFYYLCLIGGEQLADRGRLSPWLAMWLPNIVLGAAGVYATFRIATSGFSVKAARRRRR